MTRRLLAIFFTLGLAASACGDAGDPSASTAADSGDGSGTGAYDLSGVCPDPISIQTDWFPEAEHGALFEMVGDDYTVDGGSQITSGSLMIAGEDTGVDIEIRAGGPAIGRAPVASQMYTDGDITFGYASNDQQILFWDDTPMIAVVAPLEKSPQIIMWDPETHPDVSTIADLGTQGVTVNTFAGDVFIDVFVSEGVLSADQVDPSYDGSPAAFVSSGGAIAQQGFASSEPYNYEFVFEDWGRPVAFQLVHDAGLELYTQPIGIRAGDLEELRPCLEAFVPVVQMATVQYAESPDRANAIIIDAVATIDSFWVYDQGIADFSVAEQIELGLVGNGPDDTVGNFDMARVQTVIDQMRAAGMDVPDDLTAADIVTNEFIDPSIGF